MLQQVGGQASAVQMMKWAFLLSQETASGGGKTFYQFVPHNFGPHSFTLNHETNTLVRNSFVEKSGEKRWKLTCLGQKNLVNLPQPIIQDIATVINQYGKLPDSDLIDVVRTRYPWFTAGSDSLENRERQRSVADKAIYTAGYEGKTVDEFLKLLLRAGVCRLIDVRYNPISRRYGFHKSTLKRLCSSLKIDYQHLPGLGISGSARSDLKSMDSYKELFKEYRCRLPNNQDDLYRIANLLKSEPSVLVCMEANPECCHRNVLAHYLMGILELPVKHLG
ncbi:MAG: DUF488 domain-containing protein [Elainellaceae cyanobacterium]